MSLVSLVSLVSFDLSAAKVRRVKKKKKKTIFLNTFGSYLFFVYIYRHECSVFSVIYMHDLLFGGLGYGCR